MPIEKGRRLTDDRVMAQPSPTAQSKAYTDSEPEATRTLLVTHSEESLGSLAGRLAEVAHAVRQAAGRPSEVDDVDGVVADITSALGDLAVCAELSANAVIDAERSGIASRTGTTPSPGARAVSWRLHALASQLRTARDACEHVRGTSIAYRGAVGSR
jgi:hypothetical protein